MNALEKTLPPPKNREALRTGGATRREVIKSLGRYGALLGLLGGVGILAARAACQSTACRACSSLSHCDLSRARDARDAVARKSRLT